MFSKNIQWFLLGVLTTLGFLACVVFAIFYFFFPFVQFDETNGRLSLLGGAFEIQAPSMISQISKESSFVFGKIEGVAPVPSEIKKIKLQFGVGEVRVASHASSEMNWDCDGAGKVAKVEALDGVLSLDLRGAFVDCDLSLPLVAFELQGQSGEITIENIQAPVDIFLASGQVHLGFVNSQKYNLNLTVESGEVASSFDDLKSEDGLLVKVNVKVGEIDRIDEE